MSLKDLKVGQSIVLSGRHRYSEEPFEWEIDLPTSGYDTKVNISAEFWISRDDASELERILKKCARELTKIQI